jgi:hypothetical protein
VAYAVFFHKQVTYRYVSLTYEVQRLKGLNLEKPVGSGREEKAYNQAREHCKDNGIGESTFTAYNLHACTNHLNERVLASLRSKIDYMTSYNDTIHQKANIQHIFTRRERVQHQISNLILMNSGDTIRERDPVLDQRSLPCGIC